VCGHGYCQDKALASIKTFIRAALSARAARPDRMSVQQRRYQWWRMHDCQPARRNGNDTFNICWGVYLNTRTFLPMLRAADGAHIVNTSSMNGVVDPSLRGERFTRLEGRWET
jgi:NAD(P)-dependent dehydrogenase (short-subunit alcohol dehydrogenase family)